MNNRDNYKKAVEQVRASEELKEKTIQKIRENRSKKKVVYLKYLSVCAVFLIGILAGKFYYDKYNIVLVDIPEEIPKYESRHDNDKTQLVALNKDLPRFASLKELEDVIKENTFYGRTETMKEAAMEDSVIMNSAATAGESRDALDYSKTNVQVENVDEADIVKTDGNYIYYITQGSAYIIKANNLEIVNKINLNGEKERFSPFELYINDDKLILIGNYSKIEEIEQENSKLRYYNRIYSESSSQAIVYDISNKTDPIEVRTVRLDGSYRNSRMIGDNIYLISSKSAYYYDGMAENEILPKVYDDSVGEKVIAATDIAYFPGTNSYSFMTVAGFDINNKESVCTETFYGASDTVYASLNNLYITQINYDQGWDAAKNTIYKFKLNGSKIELLCKADVKGNLNNQFSMDEYRGNLRIATTSGYNEEATNQLFILDENLREIGKIEDIAVGERIYSVRFIGKIGYVVTFEQVDPLFVIDLSDPRNPEIKGELKIPGYSSYLHPYDETHIIGIGYNTKPNGYGGVTNANMKMSMFDVSDLENPTELFNVDIGEDYAYSEITYNHKVLFENKEKDLIGFPVTLRENRASDDRDTLSIFHIDLEKGFERYGEISHEIDYRTNIDRAIYIGNTIYTLADYEVKSYDLNTLEELQTLEIEEENLGESTDEIMPIIDLYVNE